MRNTNNIIFNMHNHERAGCSYNLGDNVLKLTRSKTEGKVMTLEHLLNPDDGSYSIVSRFNL